METQFGLAHVWNQGDWVTRSVALILFGMSVASWVVIVIKALDLRRHLAQARRSHDFWHSQDFATALDKLDGSDNPFRLLAQEGQGQVQFGGGDVASLHQRHQPGQGGAGGVIGPQREKKLAGGCGGGVI